MKNTKFSEMECVALSTEVVGVDSCGSSTRRAGRIGSNFDEGEVSWWPECEDIGAGVVNQSSQQSVHSVGRGSEEGEEKHVPPNISNLPLSIPSSRVHSDRSGRARCTSKFDDEVDFWW